MVHVLTNVLRKIRRAVRPEGFVLIVQPTPEGTVFEVEIEGYFEFREKFEGPVFLRNLEATHTSIGNVIAEGLFSIEAEAAIPRLDEYQSIDEFAQSYRQHCVDLESFDALSARMRNRVSGRECRVTGSYRENAFLLRKCRPGP